MMAVKAKACAPGWVLKAPGSSKNRGVNMACRCAQDV